MDPQAKDNPAPIPHLLVITGRPASGKTTLAHRLARDLKMPVVKGGILNVEAAWAGQEWRCARLDKSRVGMEG